MCPARSAKITAKFAINYMIQVLTYYIVFDIMCSVLQLGDDYMPLKDIGYLIKNINDRLKVNADADLKNFNLTLAQSRVLAFLNSKGGKAVQKEIEGFLEVSHPTVVGIVSRMEQNGFVTCFFSEDDRRNKIVTLTPKAETIGKDMESHVLENEAILLSGLSDSEVAQLKELLNKIYANLE